MEYLSSKETAIKWGISPTRVVVMAKKGMIPGAQLVGKSWLIPIDSNKPIDGRYKKPDTLITEPFIFPFLTFYNYKDSSFLKRLDSEFREYFEYEKIFIHGEGKKSLDGFKKLNEKTKNIYIKIGCLFYLSFTQLIIQNFKEFENYYNQLIKVLSIDFKYKDDLQIILTNLNAISKGNVYFDLLFNISPNKILNEECEPFLATFCAYSACGMMISKGLPIDTKLYELLAKSYEEKRYYRVALCLNLFLSLMYKMMHKKDELLMHIRKTIQLAYSQDSYADLAEYYHYFSEEANDVLKEYPPHIKEYIQSKNIEFLSAANGLASYFNHSKTLPILKAIDYKYISYALDNVPNKVIASDFDISVSAVSKKYLSLCNRFKVASKEELGAKFRSSFGNPYLIKADKAI